jgi:RNA polymerase sporulation-specific sigma factor
LTVAADRTKELIKVAQTGTPSEQNEAKNTLVRENAGLIWSVVKRFVGRGYDSDDLFQIGSIGLIKCIDKFDMSYEVKFSTYAVPMILGEIRRFLRDDGLIKVSRPLKEMAIKAKYAHEELVTKTGREPTVDEIAAAIEATPEELVLAMEASSSVESLYSTVNHGDDNSVFLIDKIGAANNDSETDMVDKLALREIIQNLSEKERLVIQMRYFQDRTQSEVAAVIGVSQVQVSRIEKRILKAMREQLT